jgi:hypothetical protein
VWYTWHLQTRLPSLGVLGGPLFGEPPVHDHLPALGKQLAPLGDHLHIIKYLTYKHQMK